MAFDAERDARRLRGAVTAASLLVLAAMAVVGWHELGRHRATTVVETLACDGGPDRCASCHDDVLAMSRRRNTDPSSRSSSSPAVPAEHLAHDLTRIACSCCHGGTPASLVAGPAHEWTGHGVRDPLMRAPAIEESCARCHPVGIRGSEALTRGARLYLGLGCALCHGGRSAGTGTAVNATLSAPKLQTLTRQSAQEIEHKLREPGTGSPMPAYAALLNQDAQATSELVSFVQSLALPRATLAREPLVSAPCTTCHAGVGGRASGLYQHRCPALAQLACGACHTGVIPDSGRECPRIALERPSCTVCHEDAR